MSQRQLNLCAVTRDGDHLLERQVGTAERNDRSGHAGASSSAGVAYHPIDGAALAALLRIRITAAARVLIPENPGGANGSEL